ncbi:MAG: LPS-assembly protein LptD, partial [Epsilonproteobacteria bacterium]|nr:LPS-assembly protein LptD [Campylobacterota bacterium]
SNIASVTLKITEDLPRHKGYILGQVYDAEAWREHRENNATLMRYGIPGVRLYMEDGRYVVTDREGKYHFVDVKNGTHVVQIDEESIRGRYKVALCEPSVRFAGRGRSQFVDIYHGEMRRVDFCLERLSDAAGRTTLELELRRHSPKTLRLTIRLLSEVPIQTPELYLALPEGIGYEEGSLDSGAEPRVEAGVLAIPLTRRSQHLTLRIEKPSEGIRKIRGILYYDTRLEQDLQSDVAELSFRESNGSIASISRAKSVVTVQSVGAETPKEAADFNWTQPTRQPAMPEYTPQEIDRLGKEPKIVWPPKGWIPAIPSARIAVLHSRKTRMKLSLNGRPVNPLHYEDRFRSSDRKMVIDYYKGVDLADGPNRIVATILSRDGRVVRRLERKVYVESRAPVKVEFLPEYSWLVADGKHPPIVAVRFIGPSGHPLRGGLVGGFTTDGRTEPLKIENGRGFYRIDSEGIAYIRLKPTTQTGESKLTFPLAHKKSTTVTIRLKPQMREWIVVGFAEGTVGYRTLHGHSDAKKAAGGDEGIYKKGRIALFAKGQILGKWLMTLAYDTGKSEEDRRLFDAIDPDEYYTLYQDATSQGSEAPSRRKLYLKLERDQFTALFGDFRTGLDETELASYQRSFTGFWSEYAGSNLRAKGFVARTDRLNYREDLPGDGTRGYYRLSHTPIVEGSEEVWIEVRDRHHPERVLSRRSMSRYTDYDIDYDKGTLYFAEPVYSRDEDLNPQMIVVKYETEGEGSHYTYGGRLALRSDTGRYEIGATYVNEGTGMGHNRLYGADLTVRFNTKTTLKMELAHTRNSEEGNVTEGTAMLAELRYEDRNVSGRIYYRQEDSDFGLGQLDPTLAGTRQMGVEARWKLSERWSLSAQLYQNRSTDDEGEDRDTNVFESRLGYRNGPWEASAGYRYVDESDESVRHQITLGLARSFLEDRLRLSLTHDQTLGGGEGGEYPTRTALKVNYRYDENTSMHASIERSRGEEGTEWRSRVGMEYHPWKDGVLTTGRLMESGGDKATRIYDTLGIRQRWTLQKSWKLSLGYEKGISVRGDDEEFDAFNGSVEFSKDPYNAHLGLGYRVGGGDKRFNFDSGLAIRHSKELGLAFGLDWHQDWGGGGKSRDVEATFAFAYRPEITDWIVLDRFEIDDSYDKDDEGEVTQTTKFV